MSEWVKWLLLGILSVAFGVFVLGNTFAASVAVTVVTGALFIVAGGVQLFAGFGQEGMGAKLLGIVLGILMIVIGISFMAHPLKGLISLTFLMVVLLFASGIVRIIMSFRMRGTEYFWMMLISGVLSLGLAVYIMVQPPGLAMNILGIFLGIELLFNGIGLIVMALFVRKGGNALREKIDEAQG